MQKWEYLTSAIGRELKGTLRVRWGEWKGMDKLQKLGQEGWELVSVVPISNFQGDGFAGLTDQIFYYLKRPIEENS